MAAGMAHMEMEFDWDIYTFYYIRGNRECIIPEVSRRSGLFFVLFCCSWHLCYFYFWFFFFTCTFVCVCVLLFYIYIFLRFVTFQNAFDFPFFTFEMYLAFLLLCHVYATFSASPSMSALVPTYLSVIHKPLRQQVSRSHHFGQSGSHISQYSARVLFSTKNFNQDPAALVEGVERWPESDACCIYDKLNINITKLLDSNYWSTCFF